MECNCYVKHLVYEARFCLHWGAHNPTCPRYRVSGDPVDHMRDVEYRAWMEPQVLRSLKGQYPMPTGLAV